MSVFRALRLVMASTFCGAAQADDAQGFVAAWLTRCYAAADAAIASNGQGEVPGFGVKDSIGTGASLPGLGFTRATCTLREVAAQLGQARYFDRQIVAGILK